MALSRRMQPKTLASTDSAGTGCGGRPLDTSQEGHAGLWRGDAVLLGGRPDVFLEYGVQCLPLLLQNARSGPSRCSARLGVSAGKLYLKSSHPWQTLP